MGGWVCVCRCRCGQNCVVIWDGIHILLAFCWRNSSFSVCAPPFSEHKILGAESAQFYTQLSCFLRESTLSVSSFSSSSSSTKWSHLFGKHTSYQHFQAFFHFSALSVERINCCCNFSIASKSSLVCQKINCWNLTVCFGTFWGICLLCMTTTPSSIFFVLLSKPAW